MHELGESSKSLHTLSFAVVGIKKKKAKHHLVGKSKSSRWGWEAFWAVDWLVEAGPPGRCGARPHVGTR